MSCFLNPLKDSTSFSSWFREFHVRGKVAAGRYSMGLDLRISNLKHLVLLMPGRSWNMPSKDLGCFPLNILCINVEQFNVKRSLNFKTFREEKVGSVWDLYLLHPTLRIHFFCRDIIFFSFC